MNQLSARTEEQLAEAVRRSCESRAQRAAFKRALKAGEIGGVAKALEDECAKRIHVSEFLRSLPGIGKVTAQRLMVELEIAPNRRIGGLGVRQRARLLEALGTDNK